MKALSILALAYGFRPGWGGGGGGGEGQPQGQYTFPRPSFSDHQSLAVNAEVAHAD